jgi:lysophospholipase L1-like esterase
VARAERRGLRAAVGAVAAVVVAMVAVLAAEVVVVLRREYLPGGAGYVVDVTVAPAGPVGDATPVELVMLGDSTVEGIGAPDPAGSLPVQTAQRVADRLSRPVHVTGLGRGGARTDGVRVDQVPRIGAADVVVVVVGSNDLVHLTPPWTMRDRTRRLLEAVHDRTRAPVVLGGTPEFGTLVSFPQPLRTAAGALGRRIRDQQRAAVAAAGPWATFTDIATEASPRFVGDPESMSEDAFHPSPVGYGYWADALAPAITAAVAS